MALRHLRYFVSVADAASVSKAALHVHGHGIAVVPSTVRFASKRVEIAPLVQAGKPLGVWGGLTWDPRRSLPIYATRFIEDLAAYTARSIPGRRFDRIGPPLAAHSTDG